MKALELADHVAQRDERVTELELVERLADERAQTVGEVTKQLRSVSSSHDTASLGSGPSPSSGARR